jgi:hypothetical protein
MKTLGDILLGIYGFGAVGALAIYVFFQAPRDEDLVESVIRGIPKALIWPVSVYMLLRDEGAGSTESSDPDDERADS